MTEDDSNTLTTSFLDVITCGLGSILLLFFLMVAIKGEMQFEDSTGAELTRSERAAVPLIVMVTGEESRPIWAPGAAQPWQPPEANFDPTWVIGQDHAILYAAQPPPSGWTLKVGPIAPEAHITVQVIAEGQRVQLPIQNVEMKSIPSPLRDGDFLLLWPLPKGARP